MTPAFWRETELTCIQTPKNVPYGLKCLHEFSLPLSYFSFSSEAIPEEEGVDIFVLASFVEGKMLEQEPFFKDNAASWRIARTAL